MKLILKTLLLSSFVFSNPFVNTVEAYKKKDLPDIVEGNTMTKIRQYSQVVEPGESPRTKIIEHKQILQKINDEWVPQSVSLSVLFPHREAPTKHKPLATYETRDNLDPIDLDKECDLILYDADHSAGPSKKDNLTFTATPS